MDELTPLKAWRVLVWGEAFGPHWGSKEEAEASASEKIAQGWDAKYIQIVEVDAPLTNQSLGPQMRIGPRGGVYTEDVSKDGRPYRRYF
jgi:hypothetical protein